MLELMTIFVGAVALRLLARSRRLLSESKANPRQRDERGCRIAEFGAVMRMGEIVEALRVRGCRGSPICQARFCDLLVSYDSDTLSSASNSNVELRGRHLLKCCPVFDKS